MVLSKGFEYDGNREEHNPMEEDQWRERPAKATTKETVHVVPLAALRHRAFHT